MIILLLGAGSKLGAAVNVDRIAGDPAGFVEGKEGDHAADVVWLSKALQACAPSV